MVEVIYRSYELGGLQWTVRGLPRLNHLLLSGTQGMGTYPPAPVVHSE